MIGAFCPGHVSCIFQPVSSYDVMSTGSRGVGIRLSIGARATVEERDDGAVNIWLDGVQSIAHITRKAAEDLAPGRGFDIRIENALPVSQGFGMSAAGAIAASLCIAEITGQSRTRAFAAAHAAEVMGGGGLGDVSAIVAGRDVPIRTVAGFPPHGTVVNAGFRFPRLTLVVLGQQLETDSVLGDSRRLAAIREASAAAMDDFEASPTYQNLFEASNRFSSESGLESPAIRRVIESLNAKGFNAGMCMLGNSVFTDAPEEAVWALLGRGRVRTYACASGSKEIIITRRA
ncbi:MAG: pantothenate kinase [Thermoplasmata archaeon]|nr:pantothenate kinase [Thermoplasmata archaeon]